MTPQAYTIWLKNLSQSDLYIEQSNCELVMRIAMNHTVRDAAADKLRMVLAELDRREQLNQPQ